MLLVIYLSMRILYISPLAVSFHLVILMLSDLNMILEGREFNMVFPFILIETIM